MNRPIKFRAWDEEEKTYYYSGDDLALFFSSFPDLPYEQFIGMEDKSSVEIYEGDIVEAVRYEGDPHKKTFKIEYMELENCGDCTNDAGIGFNLYRYSLDHITVLGSFYQNPQLLK